MAFLILPILNNMDHLYKIKKNKLKPHKLSLLFKIWLRRPDLNQRPSGYEPDELPSCSTPRYKINMVPETGLEPVRVLPPRILSPVRLPISPLRQSIDYYYIITYIIIIVNTFFIKKSNHNKKSEFLLFGIILLHIMFII